MEREQPAIPGRPKNASYGRGPKKHHSMIEFLQGQCYRYPNYRRKRQNVEPKREAEIMSWLRC
jgi:hypothetical protein